MVDPGEDSKTAAARELLEETGYVSDRWRYLGAVEPNPAFHNHLCHHWLAEDIYRAQSQDLGEGESIALEFMTRAGARFGMQWRAKTCSCAIGSLPCVPGLADALRTRRILTFMMTKQKIPPGSPSLSALSTSWVAVAATLCRIPLTHLT